MACSSYCCSLPVLWSKVDLRTLSEFRSVLSLESSHLKARLRMSDPHTPETQPTPEANESFADVFSQYEKSHARKGEDAAKAHEGTVVAVTADSVLVDIGFKSEGIFPLTEFQNDRELPKAGDKLLVSVKGRNPEGYYELTRGKVQRPADWDSLQKAFDDKATIVGTVT